MVKPDTEMQYGVVVMLDALGTKGIWRDQDLKKVTKRWEKLLGSLDGILKAESKIHTFQPKMNAFSDTIIFTFVGNTIEDLLAVASSCTSTIIGLGMIVGVYLRGTISAGKFIHTDKLILGPAIDEAAEFFESDNWIGVSTTPSTYSILRRLSEEKKTDIIFAFVKYDIPKHNGVEKKGFAIISLWKYKPISPEYPELLGKTILDLVHYHLEKSSDPTGSIKWKNLLDFLYYLKSKNIDYFNDVRKDSYIQQTL